MLGPKARHATKCFVLSLHRQIWAAHDALAQQINTVPHMRERARSIPSDRVLQSRTAMHHFVQRVELGPEAVLPASQSIPSHPAVGNIPSSAAGGRRKRQSGEEPDSDARRSRHAWETVLPRPGRTGPRNSVRRCCCIGKLLRSCSLSMLSKSLAARDNLRSHCGILSALSLVECRPTRIPVQATAQSRVMSRSMARIKPP